LNRLLEVAGNDRLMVKVIFNHGLRVSEVIAITDANVVRWAPRRAQSQRIIGKIVERHIRLAITTGWIPEERGKPFVFEVPKKG
jgi:hypothetical protein